MGVTYGRFRITTNGVPRASSTGSIGVFDAFRREVTLSTATNSCRDISELSNNGRVIITGMVRLNIVIAIRTINKALRKEIWRLTDIFQLKFPTISVNLGVYRSTTIVNICIHLGQT